MDPSRVAGAVAKGRAVEGPALAQAVAEGEAPEVPAWWWIEERKKETKKN
jgi:hypothetical protein